MTRTTDDIVQSNVFANVTGLTYPLAQVYGHDLPGDLNELAEEAWTIWTPLEDWQGAAEEESEMFTYDAESDTWSDEDDDIFASAQEICEMYNVDPHEREVFEAWAVTNWLGEKLEAYGERVTETGGLIVWSRTTTGQAIALDWVIEQIAADLNR